MYTYVYICIHMYTYVYIYIYIHTYTYIIVDYMLVTIQVSWLLRYMKYKKSEVTYGVLIQSFPSFWGFFDTSTFDLLQDDYTYIYIYIIITYTINIHMDI